MRRIIIPEPNKITLEIVEELLPGPNEACIKIAYCGICGSDLHAFKGKHPFISLPATPGHEFSGIISALGNGDSDFRVGDRVTIEPSLVCGKCYNCRIGRYNICLNLKVMGCQSDGAMADYLVVPIDKVVPLPDNVTLKEAALAEPLAVGVHAAKRGGVLFNKNIVIIGAGMIGLSTLICVARAGAKNIIVTDLSDERLKIARSLGATQTINASEIAPVEKILNIQPDEGIDIAFECVGIESSIRDAMDVVRKGGRVVVVGVFGDEVKVNMANVQDRELELIGTLMYTKRDFTEAVYMLSNASFSPELFITSVFPLDEPVEAFNAALNSKENIKVIIEVNKE
jgi:L-iditol 2-dehydrogenase